MIFVLMLMKLDEKKISNYELKYSSDQGREKFSTKFGERSFWDMLGSVDLMEIWNI